MGDMKFENIDFPRTIFMLGKTLTCDGYFEDFEKEELIENNIYIFDECLWMYKKILPSARQNFPIISFNEDNEIVAKPSILKEETIEAYDIIVNNRLAKIVEQTTEDMDFNKDLSTIPPASSSAIYMPEIKESDDFLKKLIKTIFRIKKVSTSRYRKRLSKAYAFSNLFQGLNGDTKISTIVWQTWIEILGIDAIIILKDSGGDQADPINDYLVYKSRNDTISQVPKDKINEFLSDNL